MKNVNLILLDKLIKNYINNGSFSAFDNLFSRWGESFSNKIASAAIIKRLIYHSKVFKITGESYRSKDFKNEKFLSVQQS